MKLQNEFEGMLDTKMATHNAIMEYLRRPMISELNFEEHESNLNHSAKLLSIFAKKVDTLSRTKGKGKKVSLKQKFNS